MLTYSTRLGLGAAMNSVADTSPISSPASPVCVSVMTRGTPCLGLWWTSLPPCAMATPCLSIAGKVIIGWWSSRWPESCKAGDSPVKATSWMTTRHPLTLRRASTVTSCLVGSIGWFSLLQLSLGKFTLSPLELREFSSFFWIYTYSLCVYCQWGKN